MALPTSHQSGAFHWLFQRITGILIAVVLVIHIGAVHFGISPVDLGSPFWKFFHVGFVILLLYHILNGFWLMVEDYVLSRGLRVTLFGLAWIVGVSFLILGFVTLVPFGT
ncbi:MAG: succinate dehydrogenase, hydrophobic membrane anchor protein [Planctomycetaceae bacterium]